MPLFGEGRPTPRDMGMQPRDLGIQPREEDKQYHDRAVVNGVEIEVRWDDTNNDYLIHFPQIDIGDENRQRGIYDNVIRMNQDPNSAKEVFEFAKEVAERFSDVYEVYPRAEGYIKSLR
ncbi:hypothetical protein HY622_00145 [Candidatus Uhrbacteria bacterium]|nr:hypothetical protein [Candidatus Uhrbacteria bacterium]